MRLDGKCTLPRLSQTVFCCFGLIAGALASHFCLAAQRSFPTAQAGVAALAEAVKAKDDSALREIFGPDSGNLLHSGDAVADAQGRKAFNNAYDEHNKLVPEGDAKATLVIGKDEWPLPIPLVRLGERWRFDTSAGESEILKRRIGRNEIAAMKVCLAIVDAEREYAARTLDADGVPVYTSRIGSRPGKHDGLFWPSAEKELPSPLGKLLAEAADEGYTGASARRLQPYHGYYYRILTRQGSHAPGGEKNYVTKGKLIGGFAVLAYPARHGASGVMTFQVSDDGEIFAKDLAGRMSEPMTMVFDPDATWKREDVPSDQLDRDH